MPSGKSDCKGVKLSDTRQVRRVDKKGRLTCHILTSFQTKAYMKSFLDIKRTSYGEYKELHA